jgi:hypothetical protein
MIVLFKLFYLLSKLLNTLNFLNFNESNTYCRGGSFRKRTYNGRKMKAILIGGIVILGIFLFILAFIPLGIEPLTEVYFNNHTALPAYLFLDKPYNYSFTVHNLEYQRMRYEYSVDAFDESDKLLYNLDKGEFILEDNQSVRVDDRLIMDEHFNRTKIVLNVQKDLSLETPAFKKKLWWPDPNYPMSIDIHFWVEEIRGPVIIITNNTNTTE